MTISKFFPKNVRILQPPLPEGRCWADPWPSRPPLRRHPGGGDHPRGQQWQTTTPWRQGQSSLQSGHYHAMSRGSALKGTLRQKMITGNLHLYLQDILLALAEDRQDCNLVTEMINMHI